MIIAILPLKVDVYKRQALIGRSDVAKNLIEKTTELKTDYSDYDLTFGSDLRDQAIRLMTLTLLGDGKEAALLTRDISKELSSDDWLSTQSTAFALVSLLSLIHI